MPGFTVGSRERLVGSIDLDALLATYPPTCTVKGMLCARIANLLGDDEWSAVAASLASPPRLGRYLPFLDYPVGDYTRIVHRAARKRFPQFGTREGFRQLAHADFETLAASSVGKVVMSMSDDATTSLAHFPDGLALVIKGCAASVTTRARGIRIDFAPLYGAPEYVLGSLEGILHHFDHEPITTVEIGAEHRVRYDIGWE